MEEERNTMAMGSISSMMMVVQLFSLLLLSKGRAPVTVGWAAAKNTKMAAGHKVMAPLLFGICLWFSSSGLVEAVLS